MDSNQPNAKIPLPAFLKLLTSNNVPIPKAMAIAGKVYKQYNTHSTLSQLNDFKLKAAGLDSQEERKIVMNVLRKEGYISAPKSLPKIQLSPAAEASGSHLSSSKTSPSCRPSTVSRMSTPTKRKRKRPEEINEFLPNGPEDETEPPAGLSFNEVMDEENLKGKSAIINRAPVMMSWAMVVAERLHFSREEALSIASVYTELNAVSKGVSLGIYAKDNEKGKEASKSDSQPYVDLMGRRPLYRTQAGHWRALSNGSPVAPGTAFSYISRSFRQTTPFIIGAMKMLADSYAPEELNARAWSLYAEFRPEVNEWGKRSEVQCMKILHLRKERPMESNRSALQTEKPAVSDDLSHSKPHVQKKIKRLTWEEYEASLDQDVIYDDVNLDFPSISKKKCENV
ncbi:hypothetical protein JR316_0004824 [Psilocybe cubensis]|uniref:Uncharacterized protein n=2 Tax=Psilocybe cubensis TaxID=181762 RepID=A0A8H7XYT3_PSICU|nr:hypothetical protein JR316_0004824 [Psilocybe cubensis]KAH9482724.1 hypothetical protein JR316_0004824 [Psilocybe cubensis]